MAKIFPAKKSGQTMVRMTCSTKIDRVVVYSTADLRSALTTLNHFRTESDYGLLNAGQPFTSYARVRRLTNDLTHTRLEITYRPRFPRLAPIRLAIIPDDRLGLQRSELTAVLEAFTPCWFGLVEIAFDFSTVKT